MDNLVGQAAKEFIKRLQTKYPEAEPIIEDFKWSSEDVYIDIRVPKRIRDRVQDDLSGLTWDVFDETGVYILAIAHSSDWTKTAAKKG